MVVPAVSEFRHAAGLDEGVPDAGIQTPLRHAEEPEPSSQTPLKVLEGHTGGVDGLAFFPDGRRLVSGSWDRTLIIWDITSGEVEKKLTRHTDRIRSVAVAPDGSVLASGSEDGTVRVWDGTTGSQVGDRIVTHAQRGEGVWGLAFSPDGRRVAGSSGTVQVWDVLTRDLVTGPLPGGECTVAFSPSGSRIVADGGGGTVRMWNSVNGEVIFDSLKGHTDYVRCIAFTPDEQQFVTASHDKTICRWDVQSGTLLGKSLIGHSGEIYDGVLSPDGKTLATASADHTVRFWDLKTGNQKPCFLKHESEVYRVALSRDGRLLATGGLDSKVYLWDMKAIEVEFSNMMQDEGERPLEVTGVAEYVAGQGPLKAAVTMGDREDDRKSETSSTQRRLDMPAVGFPPLAAEAEVSYYDREGEFWEEYNHAEPSDAAGRDKEKADDPNENKPGPPSQRRISKQLKRLGQSLKPSKKSKGDPEPPPPPHLEAPGVPASSMTSDPPTVVDPASASSHWVSENERAVDVHPPSTSVLPSHSVSKFAGSRAWKSFWQNPSRGGQPQVTTVYAERAQYGTVVAADPFQPAQVPPQSETAPGHYATHSVLPPSSTDDSDDSAPNENIDDRSQVARCGLCSRLFSRRSNPRPDNHGVDNSGVGGMSERRWETEDDSTLVTPTS